MFLYRLLHVALPWHRVGLDDLQRTLTIPTIPWLYDSRTLNELRSITFMAPPEGLRALMKNRVCWAKQREMSFHLLSAVPRFLFPRSRTHGQFDKDTLPSLCWRDYVGSWKWKTKITDYLNPNLWLNSTCEHKDIICRWFVKESQFYSAPPCKSAADWELQEPSSSRGTNPPSACWDCNSAAGWKVPFQKWLILKVWGNKKSMLSFLRIMAINKIRQLTLLKISSVFILL